MSVTFPNVPNLPGVPQLARLPGSSPLVISIASTVIGSLFGNVLGLNNGWGIYDASGNVVFEADSILDFEHHPQWSISNFPVQGSGSTPTAFASYNKVKLPYECRVRMCKAGSLADRQALLTALDSAANSIALYTITTPEKNYQNADIQHYDLVRTTEGIRSKDAYFLTEIDIYFTEVVPVQAQYSTTALANAVNPSAIPQSVTGMTIPQIPTGAIVNQLASASLSGAFGAF